MLLAERLLADEAVRDAGEEASTARARFRSTQADGDVRVGMEMPRCTERIAVVLMPDPNRGGGSHCPAGPLEMVDVEVAVPAREQDRMWTNRLTRPVAPEEGWKSS